VQYTHEGTTAIYAAVHIYCNKHCCQLIMALSLIAKKVSEVALAVL